MAKVMLVNPKKRHVKKRRTAAQKAATRKMLATNRRRRKSPARKTVSRAPVKRRRRKSPVKRRRTYKRNPSTRSMLKNVMNQQIIPAAQEAGGALALDVLFGYLGQYVPAQLQGGMIGHVTKTVAAIGMGVVASNFMNNKTATTLARGAITVTLHDALKETISNMAPQIPLGYYSPAYVAPNMGYYVDDLASPLLTAQDQYTPAATLSPNMGYYENTGSEYDTSMDYS